MNTRTPLRIAAWTMSGLLGLGIAAGAAEAVTGHRTAPPADTAALVASDGSLPDQVAPSAAGPRARAGKALLRRAVHGEVTVRTKDGYRTLDFQRGQVSAVDGTSVTVRSPDGFTATYSTDKDTKVRRNRQPSSVGDLKPGDKVAVVAVKNADGLLAKRILATDRTPRAARGSQDGSASSTSSTVGGGTAT